MSDPELLDDPDEGTGDESAYNDSDAEVDYDHEQFAEATEGDDDDD